VTCDLVLYFSYFCWGLMSKRFLIGILICLYTSSLSSITLKRYDGAFFSINMPKGWKIYTAGQCSDFTFLIRDPSKPLRQIFYFGEIGPVYICEEQKQIDYQYMNMGGYPIAWYEMPVVNPLTPSNFLKNFHLIASTEIAKTFMRECPKLKNLQIISTVLQKSPIGGDGSTELIRALFTRDGKLGEGLFLVTVVPVLPYTGGPGAGIGYGFMFMGITASKDEFPNIEKILIKSLESFTISEDYVANCMRQQQATYEGILRAGKTLSEASDIILEGWQNRNRSDDILSEKRSDAILGRERLYNPETGDVYEFENGFYDKYNIDRNKYVTLWTLK